MEPVTIRSIEDKEPIINVIMKITFVVLLLILIGGLGYIFTTSNKKPVTKVAPTTVPDKHLISSNLSEGKLIPAEEFQGRILGFENKAEVVFPKDYKPEFFLYLDGDVKNAKTKQLFFFDKNELNYIKVLDVAGKTISYKNLKIGQNIKLVKTYDLKKLSYKNIEITIIN